MSHPRIEEVSDSEEDANSDPSEGDIDDFTEQDIMRRKDPVPGPSSSQARQPPVAHPPQPRFQTTADPSAFAGAHALYPVYFDAARSRSEGRRVPAEKAVRNPLARDVVAACAALGLRTLYEPHKTHPKDWANPGRARVYLKEAGHVKNKRHLYGLVAAHLARHPVTEDSASLRETFGPAGPAPPVGEKYPRPAVPRGWKVGELLPYYSPALTGGGVSENLFRDMMREMQGGGDMPEALAAAAAASGGSGGGGGGGKKKKGKGKA
jgi:signal recognition particle subunit SRP19